MTRNSKIQHQNVLSQNRVFKNTMIHNLNRSCKKKYKIKRERERERERERNNILKRECVRRR